MSWRWWRYPLFLVLAMIFTAGLLGVLAAVMVYPRLPSLDALTDYRPKMPLRVYTADGALIGEFGEERRALVKTKEAPVVLRQAILAAEDERFYQHGGVDYVGVMRAALSNLMSGGASQGASTITMQVARNFFLTPEKTLSRKFSEALLALKIEHKLSKDQILELYLNQIYLGQRAYGFASAAQIYFGKPLSKLTAAEAAMLAGLPKAPSRFNPVVNPKRAKMRQQYVLGRMRELGYLDQQQYEAAVEEPLKVRHELQFSEVSAAYVAEMVRQMMYARYQDAIYSQGFTVYTTLRKADQEAANQALWRGVMDYDRRHGYRGPEGFLDVPADSGEREAAMDEALQELEEINGLVPVVVLEAKANRLTVYAFGGEVLQLGGEGVKFVQKYLGESVPEKSRIRRGSVIRIQQDDKLGWRVTQLPQIEAAFVAVNPVDGAVKALVGGFDFGRNKYNHVVQAMAPAGVKLQAFHLFRRPGKGVHPGDGDQRRSHRAGPGGNRGPAVGAQKLRRQLLRADSAARRFGQIEEPGIHPHFAKHHAPVCPGVHHPLRFRGRAASALSDHGPGCGVGNAFADGGGLFRVRQRRVPGEALFHPAGAGFPGQAVGPNQAGQGR
jgi:Membrane carboxypeptidase/penicillin-binding protein